MRCTSSTRTRRRSRPSSNAAPPRLPHAAAVAGAAPLVFACLPNGRTSEAVAQEVAKGGAVRTYVEMSTIGSPAMQRIAAAVGAQGIALADCPISGGPKGARAGTLTVLCAAPAEVRAQIRPCLDAIGRTVFEIGDRPGQAQLMKLVNNLVNAANMATAFEALVLGAKGGLDPDQMVAVLNVSTGQNSATLTKVPNAVLPGSFDYGSSLTTMLKDVESGPRGGERARRADAGAPAGRHAVAPGGAAGARAAGLHRDDQAAGGLGGGRGAEPRVNAAR